MVSRKARKRATIRLIIVLIFLTTLSISFAICTVIKYLAYREQETIEEVRPENLDDIEPTEPEPVLLSVDFQPVVDAWVKSVSGKKGLVIYDLDLNKVVGEYNVDQKFSTASLYKLFVVYEGYRLVQNGEWDGNGLAGKTGKTILKCLDLAIRESNSACAETLWGMMGRDKLNEIAQTDFGIKDVVVSSLTATPKEIMQMMQVFYKHDEIVDENLITTMQDSFLNQPITTYNWRQGLPSGFSEAVKVYNKVGWNYDPDRKIWTIYDDTAIVKFAGTEDLAERNFIIVVMTSGINFTQIRRLGTEIEAAFNAAREAALVSAEEL